MRIFLFFVLVMIGSSSFAQNKLRAYIDHKQFYAPGVGNYVEFQLQFVGHTIVYNGVDGGLSGELAVYLDIFKEDSVVRSEAYRLQTPLMRDSIVEDFFDVLRFKLDPGNYSFLVELKDLNSDNPSLKAKQGFTVEDLNSTISFSDILIAETASKGDGTSPFYKSGYDIIPRFANFYPEQLTAIPLYFEVYNTHLLGDSLFGIQEQLIDANTGNEVPGFKSFKRYTVGEAVPVFRKINLETVPTGKYLLKYTLINKGLIELATKEYEFERSNDISADVLTENIILDPAFQNSITDDSVGYYLESLIPISGPTEVRNIIDISKQKDEEAARKYIQQYWTATSKFNAYEEWIKYKQQVQLVERLYSNNFQEGFETDRGRVYLQYGSPTNIVRRDVSSSEYPYEIWQYNKIGVFSNKRFVFYNPDLVNNAYRLLHSDMIGELKNPNWPRELVKRNSTNGNVDDPNSGVIDHWGGNSDDLFRQY